MIREAFKKSVIILYGLLFFTPIYFLVTISIKRKSDIFTSRYTPFVEPRFDNYIDAWKTANIGQFFLNSTVIIASLPLTILYAIFQRQFISGVTAGAIKG